MVSNPVIDQKGLVKSARRLFERNLNKGRYKDIVAEENRESLSLLLGRIKAAGVTGQPISYSEWIVGVKWQASSGQHITISSPKWEGQEKEIVSRVLEYITLYIYAKEGFLVTSLVYDGRDQKDKLSGDQLSVLMQEIEFWEHDSDHFRKVDPKKHKKLVEVHQKQAYAYYKASSQSSGI